MGETKVKFDLVDLTDVDKWVVRLSPGKNAYFGPAFGKGEAPFSRKVIFPGIGVPITIIGFGIFTSIDSEPFLSQDFSQPIHLGKDETFSLDFSNIIAIDEDENSFNLMDHIEKLRNKTKSKPQPRSIDDPWEGLYE